MHGATIKKLLFRCLSGEPEETNEDLTLVIVIGVSVTILTGHLLNTN